jgi:hypothetical protein
MTMKQERTNLQRGRELATDVNNSFHIKSEGYFNELSYCCQTP